MEVLDASEPTGSGTAEPKVEEKTDDEEAPAHSCCKGLERSDFESFRNLLKRRSRGKPGTELRLGTLT